MSRLSLVTMGLVLGVMECLSPVPLGTPGLGPGDTKLSPVSLGTLGLVLRDMGV